MIKNYDKQPLNEMNNLTVTDFFNFTSNSQEASISRFAILSNARVQIPDQP